MWTLVGVRWRTHVWGSPGKGVGGLGYPPPSVQREPFPLPLSSLVGFAPVSLLVPFSLPCLSLPFPRLFSRPDGVVGAAPLGGWGGLGAGARMGEGGRGGGGSRSRAGRRASALTQPRSLEY